MIRSTGTGTWAEAYAPPARSYAGVHTGGPADGERCSIPARQPPQARFYAPVAARKGRAVVLHRYVLAGMFTEGEITYQWAGTWERSGPLPGLKATPDWS